MVFMEIMLSIHLLVLLSSWCIGGAWLVNKPSVKLKLVRLLLVSCILSPVAIQCLGHNQKPIFLQFTSLDALHDYVKEPILKPKKLESSNPIHVQGLNGINFWQVFCILYCIALAFPSYCLWLNLHKLNSILRNAVLYRSSGRLVIKISNDCHIPFAVKFLNKSYIVLPVSILSSTKDMHIAIAHEGQHHRNGDCLWTYIIEVLRIICLGNPGVRRWHTILSELQEFSCDEVLVGRQNISAYDYGRCLYNVVQTASQHLSSCQRELACTVGMALSNGKQETSFIMRRFTMLSNYQANSSRMTLIGVVLSVFAILIPVGFAYSTMGSFAGYKGKELNVSHVDPSMQKLAAEEIAKAVKQYHAKSGVIAVANPNTGEVIAFAEAGDVSENKSWKSRVFSPGSTIKPFIAAVAIESKTASASKKYDCQSPYEVEGKQFTNYNDKFSSATLEQAVAQSVNICLIKVAQEIGSKILRQQLTNFGFDMNSWWHSNHNEELQLANASLGANIPVTLDTLLKSYSILANHGINKSGAVISEATASTVTRMLEKAVSDGTGKNALIQGTAVAGKTGTVVQNNDGTHLALFAGYSATEANPYVVVVVIENGFLAEKNERLTTGGELAAPVFRNFVGKIG